MASPTATDEDGRAGSGAGGIGAGPDTPGAGDPSAGPQPADEGRRGLPDWALLAITAVVTLPIAWLGYGTDLDIGDVRRTGALIRDLDYHPSRTPGVPVFETLVAVLDPLGHIAINVAAALAAGATVVGIARIVRTLGHPNGDLVGLAFLASPVVVIAGTSSTDFIFAVAFFTWAVVCHLHDRSVLAGLLFALAIGSRSSTVVLIATFLLADAWDPRRRGRCLRTALVMVPLAGVLYVPSWLAFGRTLEFLDHTSGWRGLKNNAGRFAYKNYVVAGAAFGLVALVALPALVRSLRTWSTNPLVRIGVLGFVGTELLFLQLPWKPAHLIPALLALLLWVAAGERNSRPFLWVLIGAIALNGLVAFRPLTPDRPDQSQSADFDPVVMFGLLANDVRCRARYMDVEPHMHNGAWYCFLEPLRGPTHVDPGGPPPTDLDVMGSTGHPPLRLPTS